MSFNEKIWQKVEYKKETGTYTPGLEILSDKRYCLDDQDCSDIRTIMEREDIFTDVQIHVIEDVPVLSEYCTSRPCFNARVEVSVPSSSEKKEEMHVYIAKVNENMKIGVHDSESSSERNRASRRKICY